MRLSGTWILSCSILLAGCVGGSAKPDASSQPQQSSVVIAGGEGVGEVGGTIEGTVVDDANTPIASALVLLKELNLQAVADDAGHFEFRSVAPGTYTVFVSKLGYDSIAKRVAVQGEETSRQTFILTALPVAEPFHETQIKAIEILFGLSWAVLGDFNQGCVVPGATCQGVAVATLQPLNGPNFVFTIDDPKVTPVATIVHEQTWIPNSAVCAKTIQVGIYNPKAPSIANPSSTNPHYWTNYPHPQFGITSPIWMRIPRNETGNPDAIDDATRVERYRNEKKEQWLPVGGNWTVRDFPPGKGLTNQPADLNCFTQQKVNLFWTTFFLDPSPVDFSARPDA